jgi:RHS repeat-associated protein
MKEVSPTATETFDWNTVSGGKIPEELSDGANSYVYGPLLFGGSAPIEQINEATNTASFIASTPSGVQAVFTGGSTSTLTELAAYSVWGTQSIQSGTMATPFGFQGGYTDSSGLEFLVNRYYDSSTQQFVSIDPEVTMTLQPYSMEGDDPLNATDPLGFETLSQFLHWCASPAAFSFCYELSHPIALQVSQPAPLACAAPAGCVRNALGLWEPLYGPPAALPSSPRSSSGSGFLSFLRDVYSCASDGLDGAAVGGTILGGWGAVGGFGVGCVVGLVTPLSPTDPDPDAPTPVAG